MRRVSPAERLWAKSPGADVALSTWEESRLPACAPAAALEARPLLAPHRAHPGLTCCGGEGGPLGGVCALHSSRSPVTSRVFTLLRVAAVLADNGIREKIKLPSSVAR